MISGYFNNVDGKPRPGYAKLIPDGRVDESFAPWPTNPPAFHNSPPFVTYNYRDGTFGGVYPAETLSDGSVAVVIGTIPLWSGVIGVYRLDATGRLIPSASYVSPSAFPSQSDLNYMLQNDGFCGDWSGTNAAAVFKAFFAKVPLELCRVAVQLPDGGAILGIRDKFVNGILTDPGRFMRFDKNWEPDFSFTNRYEADRRGSMTIKRLKDGKFLVAGGFGKMNGEGFPGLVRLNEDGQIDHSFHCEITSSLPRRPVMDIAVQEDGRIVICGSFTAVNGVKRLYIARLNPDGSLDDTFKSPFIGMEEFQARRFPVYHLAATPAPAETNMVAPSALTTPAETILITSMNYQGGMAMIQFIGSPNKPYILQAKDTLDVADWSNISTNQSNANGNGSFRDTDAKNHPTRFYRIAAP